MAPIGLNGCVDQGNACWLKNPVPPLQANPCRVSGVVGETLVPLAFKPFKVGQILPQGWINDQLQLQADGLAGKITHNQFLKQRRHMSNTLANSKRYLSLKITDIDALTTTC